ncbi:hypothetical protein EGK14_00235 [Erwinia sp. 198]|nr:hypothetical protein EGK14_00235 [Erwinia sp. 198]
MAIAVSVAIPTCNREALLNKRLQVMLRQDALGKPPALLENAVRREFVYGFEIPDAMLADLTAFIRTEDVGASVNFLTR